MRINHGFVIVQVATGKFWGGRRWVTEYPDAFQYDNNVRAIHTCTDLNSNGACASVYVNYGLDTERRIYPSPDGSIHKWPGSIGG